MDYNILYNIDKNILEYINLELVLDKLYLLEYKVPDIKDIKNLNKKNTDKNIIELIKNPDEFIISVKNYISNLEYKMPLYDIYTSNIYLINRENIYMRVYYNHYRFPDKNVIDDIKKQYDKL